MCLHSYEINFIRNVLDLATYSKKQNVSHMPSKFYVIFNVKKNLPFSKLGHDTVDKINNFVSKIEK